MVEEGTARVAFLQAKSPQRFDGPRSAKYGHGMSRKKISTTVYITPEQNVRLKQLHDRTRVPVAEYIRQGIDLILAQYAEHLPGQTSIAFDEQAK